MEKNKFDDKDKIDILKHAEAMQRKELALRREDENRIYPWVSGILVAVNGALIVARFTTERIRPLSCCEKLIATILIILLIGISISWQNLHRKKYLVEAKVIVHIETLLHYFDDGAFGLEGEKALFPEEWKHWGEDKIRLIDSLFYTERGLVYVFLGAVAIGMMWIP